MAIGIDFPTPGFSVPGGGSLFAWGTDGPNETTQSATITWTENGSPQERVGTMASLTNRDWAFSFHSVKADNTTTVTLTVSGVRMEPGPPPTSTPISASVSFKCK